MLIYTEKTIDHLRESLNAVSTRQFHACLDCDRAYRSHLDADRDEHTIVIDHETGNWSIAVGCELYEQGERDREMIETGDFLYENRNQSLI